ncbi:uncharacterized protein LOC121369821 [Gigantopelta aegis]|uniref:uncharacterized protein LOC121369821 n=1 Tax=Gigantopelta aegis TaxID=1735272 RepID=UPI001B8899EF|nr:uncharacterized protein LOC121369821 [Gigantopelta aegis]
MCLATVLQHSTDKRLFFSHTLIRTIQESFRQIAWHFFEASHGKGASDGVGISVKRTADRLERQGHDIPDATSLFNLLQNQNSSIKLFHISSQKAEEKFNMLAGVGSLMNVKGTMQLHEVMSLFPDISDEELILEMNNITAREGERKTKFGKIKVQQVNVDTDTDNETHATKENQRKELLIQDALDSLGGSQWFTLLGQGKPYHQGFIKEECRHLTAFITPWGLYEWNRIPFVLSGAPTTFQRFMNECLDGIRDKFCLPYLDDILVCSQTFKDHIQNIKSVLQRLREKGIKLKPRKCELFRKKVRYLGHLVTPDGYTMDPADKEAVASLGR